MKQILELLLRKRYLFDYALKQQDSAENVARKDWHSRGIGSGYGYKVSSKQRKILFEFVCS